MLVSIPFTTRQDEVDSSRSDEQNSALATISSQELLVDVDATTPIHIVRFSDGKIGFDILTPDLRVSESLEDYNPETYLLITETTLRQLIGKTGGTVLDA